MQNITRRHFIKVAGAASAASILVGGGCARRTDARPRVVVVGGGFGGATCAKYLRRYDDNLDVTLVEPAKQYVTCPGSNWVLGGMREMADITHDYSTLRDTHGVNVIHDWVEAIDADAREVRLKGGERLEYDRLVVSPGIDFRWDAVEGYGAEVSERIPHAWKAGAQTELLQKQLQAMPDGGTFIMVAPPNPFRCPPGPYERVSMVAHYFKNQKPRSKILILDAKDAFSKQGLFTAGWEQLYPGMIEWVAGSQGGIVERLEADAMRVVTEEGFTTHQGDVINFIPAQHAGRIARDSGLTDADGWCPVDQRTFESTIHPGVHVIGDAAVAGAMPKSGHSANNQAKMCAAAIVAAMHDLELPAPSHVNTCYSLVSPDYGISVAAVYRLQAEAIEGVEGAGGVSPAEADARFRAQEALYAQGWYAGITQDTFG